MPSKTSPHVRSTISFFRAAGSYWNWVFLVLALAPGHRLLLGLEQDVEQQAFVADVARILPVPPLQALSCGFPWPGSVLSVSDSGSSLHSATVGKHPWFSVPEWGQLRELLYVVTQGPQ